jgi:hypothetical protein
MRRLRLRHRNRAQGRRPPPPAIFRLLPGGPADSLIGAGQLGGSWGEPLTFTRSSAAICERADGSLVSLAANLPRVEASGLRVEGAATNILVRSEPTLAQMTQAGVTQASGLLGLGGGAIFPATATSDYAYVVSTAAVSTAYVLSVYVQMADGSAPAASVDSAAGDFRLKIANELVTVAPTVARVGTSTVYRVSGTLTTPASIVNQFHGVVRYNTQSAKAFTVTGYQLETGSTATSYIPTVGTAATRTAEVATVPTPGWPTGSGTVEVTYTPMEAAATVAIVLDTRTDTTSSGWLLYRTTTALVFRARDVAANFDATSGALTWTPGQSYRLRGVVDASTIRVYRDDVLLGSTSTATMGAVTHSAGVAKLGGSGTANGHLSSLRISR